MTATIYEFNECFIENLELPASKQVNTTLLPVPPWHGSLSPRPLHRLSSNFIKGLNSSAPRHLCKWKILPETLDLKGPGDQGGTRQDRALGCGTPGQVTRQHSHWGQQQQRWDKTNFLRVGLCADCDQQAAGDGTVPFRPRGNPGAVGSPWDRHVLSIS